MVCDRAEVGLNLSPGSGVAHSPQNFAVGRPGCPQDGQATESGVAHSAQNFGPTGFRVPQFEQITAPPAILGEDWSVAQDRPAWNRSPLLARRHDVVIVEGEERTDCTVGQSSLTYTCRARSEIFERTVVPDLHIDGIGYGEHGHATVRSIEARRERVAEPLAVAAVGVGLRE